MDFIVDDLRRDTSRGSNFKILFTKKISLEEALQECVQLLNLGPNKPKAYYTHNTEYGYIDLHLGDLTIKDERKAARSVLIEGPHDHYRVTENNMDYHQLKALYDFLNSYDENTT